MRCNKASTCYMLMVDFTVMDDDGYPSPSVVRAPVMRNKPGIDPMALSHDQEASCYITREDAESHRQQWADRFPHATYYVMEITPR